MSALSEKRKQFIEVSDLVLRSTKLMAKIEEQADDILAIARPTLALMKLERLPATGEMLRDVENGILWVENDKAVADDSFKTATANLRKAGLALAKLNACAKLKTTENDRLEIEEELRHALWYAQQATEEITVLHAQIERSAQSLNETLPI